MSGCMRCCRYVDKIENVIKNCGVCDVVRILQLHWLRACRTFVMWDTEIIICV